MNCPEWTVWILISSQKVSHTPLVSSRSPEVAVQIHTGFLLPAMPPNIPHCVQTEILSCTAPTQQWPKADTPTQLRNRARIFPQILSQPVTPVKRLRLMSVQAYKYKQLQFQ